jgi:16S rRNA (cytosine967-C5)-methyltransferase
VGAAEHSVAPARHLAFEILLDLRRNPHTHSDELLRSHRVHALSDLDKGLCTALVMGVLRWQLLLDQTIHSALTMANPKLAEPIEVALQLGALQLLVLDRIPAHAAVFESVELVRSSGNSRAAGLVNAVLRKLSRLPKISQAQAPQSFPLPTSVRGIAHAWAHPEWLVARWVRSYGAEATVAICRYDQSPPVMTVRLMSPNAEAALKDEGVELAPAAFVDRARRVVRGEIQATGQYLRGLVRIQDEGSQLIAEVAAAGGKKLDRAARILDCCAAPGGKTAVLGERNPQAEITACDIHPRRLAVMKKLLSGYPSLNADGITFRNLDAAQLTPLNHFDTILCDVPCSGTGTLARNPEIRYRLASNDFIRQQKRQEKILTAAAQVLAPGGELVYSTCSLEPEENEDVIHRVLRSHKGLRLISWKERMLALEEEGVFRTGSTESLFRDGYSAGFLRTLPGIQSCDGFFAAIIQRAG